MPHQSLQSTYFYGGEEKEIIYNLYFKNAFYSFECFIDGDVEDYGYAYVENITEDEGKAEHFWRSMYDGKVLPVHINELVEEFFA